MGNPVAVKYYTYIHSTPYGDVFYVGKGCGRRVYAMSGRTLHWRKIVKENKGLTMQIVKEFETEGEAFIHEQELIKMYASKGCALVNLTDGGKGPLGYCFTAEHRNHLSKLMTGYKHAEIECPHCGTKGGATTMKRWHFDNCAGVRKFKARATVDGKRIFLGNFATKKAAYEVALAYYTEAGKSAPKEFYRSCRMAGIELEHT